MSDFASDLKRNYRPWIILITVVIYAGVALASYIPGVDALKQMNLTFLPGLNAILNSLNFITLVGAFIAIRNKNVDLHRKLIFTALVWTSLFLVSYLMYHFSAESTPYGGEGILKYAYYFILLTHIVLAAAIVPISLTAIGHGLNMDVEKHKKVARWAMPIWLYVSMTGVIVYLMIAPYYNH